MVCSDVVSSMQDLNFVSWQECWGISSRSDNLARTRFHITNPFSTRIILPTILFIFT